MVIDGRAGLHSHAMQRAFDDATNRLARRLEAESIAPPPPLRRPSRLMLTGTPAPGRLEAAAADRDLDEARALCGTAWTNRLAALLPDGWRLGPCVGVGDGENGSNRRASTAFKAPRSFRYINCWVPDSCSTSASRTRTRGRVVLGEPGDPDGRGWQDFALRPGEHLASMFCGYPGFVEMVCSPACSSALPPVALHLTSRRCVDYDKTGHKDS